jgi:hypothetical protein
MCPAHSGENSAKASVPKRGSEILNMVVLRLFVLRYTHRPEGELLEN